MAMDLFNQGMRVTLINALKRILDQYPNNGQILKEVLQNAEDAGATDVKFLLDETHYGDTMGVPPDDPAYPYLGPALYVYNDARLTDDDWKGISDIEGSIKANDPTTIGRFGLGLKSIFHITDVPSIYSGNNLGILDPHEQLLRNEGYRVPVYGCSIHGPVPNCPGKNLFKRTPYRYAIFNSKRSLKDYQHTIFRFPLRIKKHSSQLTSDGSSADDIWQLLETLTQESYMNLLFLKNIEKIHVYRKKSQVEEPCLHFTIELSEGFLKETQRGRGKTKEIIKSDWKRYDAHACVAYRMGVRETKCSKSGQMRLKETQWLVCNYIGTGAMTREIIRLSDQLHLIPMVGVAVQLGGNRSDQGHLYCCLPLPLEGKNPSGLPVHINGCFVLNQTRHHIKWSTTDHDGTKNNEIKWNLYLVKHILPNAYINLLLEIKHIIGDGGNTDVLLSCLVNSLPCKHEAEPHWKTLVSELYKLYSEEELVFSEARNGWWVQPDEAWYLETNMEQSQRQLLHRLLCYLGEPVVTLPDHVISGINEHAITSLVSSCMVRKALRRKSLPVGMSKEERFEILKYILSDEQFYDLDNIALLPLGTGDFTSFTTRFCTQAVYLDSRDHPRSLLPGIDHLFLASMTDYELMQNLVKLAVSGRTQLKNFDSDAFITYLPQVSTINQTQSWFEIIWKYISRQFPNDLSKLEGKPILPVTLTSGTAKHLELRTGRPWLLLVEWTDDQALQNALSSLGITLIRSIDCMQAYNHPQIRGKYILENSLEGVLRCLQYISCHSDQDHISNNFRKNTNGSEKLTFQKYCSKIVTAWVVPDPVLSLLKKLHMFILQRISGRSPTSCEQNPVGCRDNMIPHKESVVDLAADQTRILAETLGMQIVDTTNLIEKHILRSCIKGRYSDDETNTIVDFIFQNHLTRHMGICNQLSKLTFVFTQSGHKKVPGALFDPKDSLIRPFLKMDVVPGTRYMIYIDQLKKLGLKTRDTVTAEDVFHFASDLGSNTQAAKNFVTLLSNRSELLTEVIRGRELGRRLHSLEWVPVKQKAPSDYPQELCWFGKEVKLATPGEIISDNCQYIVGAIVPVTACSEDDLVHYYNWKRIPDLDHVFQQLQMVYNVFQCRPVTCHTLVSKMTESIYGHIQGMLHKPVVLQLCKKIKDMIWNGEKFISAEKILTNPPLPNLEPYVYRLPENLKTFRALLVQCGMKETCSLTDLLHEIRNTHDPPQCHERMRADHDRQLAISILYMLSKQNLETGILDNIPIPVYTNDGTLRMCEIKYCVYDERMGKSGFSVVSSVSKFVHPGMPMNLVQALKIRTLVSHVLEVTQLDFEDFGQIEPITVRLKNILEEYPDGSSVPKELIQNADDAGATEVSFVFDERQHENFKTTLFDSNMAKCQGPALFEYNNALFTDQDFQNVIKLGGRTKQDQLDKLGRFGLGFNAVYHLTDVPTFISGKFLVMLDPNMSHLRKCVRDTKSPGIRVDIGRKKAVEQFRDQYQPYEGIHGCSILGCEKDGYKFPGTLFRFPLRTSVQAESSEICEKIYNRNEMKKLLKLFIKSIDGYLLFTQNVTKITVYNIPKHANSFAQKILLCSVEKTIQQVDTSAERNIPDNKILKIASDMIKSGRNAEITSTTITTIQCSIPAVAKTYLQLENEGHSVQPWLVCQHVAAGIVRQMPKDLKGLPPVSGVAVALSNTGSTYHPRPLENGTFFCFLPLPIMSGLPVHINGSFAVSTNRRHIIEKSSDDKYCPEGTWNEMLLTKLIPVAYIKALDILTSNKTEFDIWPICKAGSSVHTITLSQSVLTRIALDTTLHLFTDGLKKSSFSGVAFLKHDEFTCEVKGIKDCSSQAKEVLRSVVGKQGIIVVDMPASVFSSFRKAGLESKITRGMFTKERFLKEIFLPHITTVDRYVRDVIILMAILSNSTYIDQLLQTTNCVPVGLDGIKLLVPGKVIDPRGTAAEIYTDSDGRFPFPGLGRATNGNISFCSEKILKCLERIGMIKDCLTPGDICERAESIVYEDPDIGLQRSRKIIQFMSSIITKGDTSPLVKLKEVMVLPVMAKPKLYPLPWYNVKTKFCKPKEAFISVDRYVVGSVAPVVEKEIFSGFHDVACLLGLVEKSPSLGLIQRQLEILLRQNPSSNQNYKSKVELYKCFTSVFNALEVMLRSRKQSSELDTVLNKLKFTPCILVNNIFVSPTSCAFIFNGHCEPWLCQVPHVIKDDCPNLLRKIGVKEQFSVEDFIMILSQKKLLYDTKPLKSEDLEIAVNVVHQLTQHMLTSGLDITELQKTNDIYIPDTKSVLRPCSELCLFDGEFEADKDAKFAHRTLSIQAGSAFCKLGIKTSKQHTLTKRTFGIPFGQSEKLQNRIRRILSGYPFDTTVLKELLQNADDAGATELHFILDPRTHSSKNVFDDGWKSLQGPALCVYNNNVFTEADIEGIKKLGEGSKSEDATKTGQYGVGFNCVYHITDTPTFMTSVEGKGVVLVAFDPTCSYVSGATIHEPGIMFVDIDRLRDSFPDVFKPFMTHAFPLHNSTMFRLPLRNCTKEPSAHLLKKNVTVDYMSVLLKNFEREAGDCLLFLKHLCKVSFSHIDKRSGKLVRDYWVHCVSSPEASKKKTQFLKTTQTLAHHLSKRTLQLTQTGDHEVSYLTRITDSDGIKQDWIVVQSFGFRSSNMVPSSVVQAHMEGSWGLIPLGGIAGLIRSNKNKTPEQTPCHSHKKTESTPMGNASMSQGYIYCFLPLPLHHNMPVHLNGHFALDHESRRNLWGRVGDSFKSTWNSLLMRSIIAPAYISFMVVLQEEILHVSPRTLHLLMQNKKQRKQHKRNIDFYNSFFVENSSNQYVQEFVDEFYRLTYNTHASLFPVIWKPSAAGVPVIELFSLTNNPGKQAVFKSKDLLIHEAAHHEQCRNISNTKGVTQILEACAYRFFQAPTHVSEILKRLNCEVDESSPEHVFQFFIRCNDTENPCHLSTVPLKLSESPFPDINDLIILFKYCARVADFNKRLQGLPLLVTADGMLRIFDGFSPVFSTEFSHIFFPIPERFMHDRLVREHFLEVDISDIKQVKTLDIAAFAELLPEVLDETYKAPNHTLSGIQLTRCLVQKRQSANIG